MSGMNGRMHMIKPKSGLGLAGPTILRAAEHASIRRRESTVHFSSLHLVPCRGYALQSRLLPMVLGSQAHPMPTNKSVLGIGSNVCSLRHPQTYILRQKLARCLGQQVHVGVQAGL